MFLKSKFLNERSEKLDFEYALIYLNVFKIIVIVNSIFLSVYLPADLQK